jgi:glycosyltransferase involved in cell wall biosynthesis
MLNVLWLASWYPNRTDPFNGDFIERHAIAVSKLVKLTVIFIVKDESLQNGKVQIEKTAENNCTVYRVYYGRKSSLEFIEKLSSLKTYYSLQQQLYHQIINEQGKPDIVHVQVAMKGGMLARQLKKKFNIPYIVTEHWTGYFKQHEPNIYSGNRILKWLNKKILAEANLFLPVSKNLGDTVNRDFTPVTFQVIPNAVNTQLFFPVDQAIHKFRFIHPSLMNYQKNPEGILLACKMVKARGISFELLMVGKEDKALNILAKQYGLDDGTVIFKPAISYAGVANEMQQSSALLLFSRFENLPCVVLEALCSGLPVISTNVGGINEVINDSNGILIENENTEQLANAMCTLINNYKMYNKASIATDAAKKFNYVTVGHQYLNVYHTILKTTV